MRTTQIFGLASAMAIIAGTAYAQDRSSPSGTFELPKPCRASGQASDQGMQGMGSMASAQNTGEMSEAHRGLQDAMRKMQPAMMQGMMAKDPDLAWACSMLPHHQGAIEMSRAALKEASNAEIRKMAEKTIRDQEKDIAEIKEWIEKHGKQEGGAK